MPVAYDASLVSTLDQTQHPRCPIRDRHRVTGSPLRGARRGVLAIGLTVGLAVAATACDTGDGKTLPDPTGTLPPPTVATTTTELPRDGVGTLASLPIEPLPADAELPAPIGPFDLTAPWFDGDQIEVINTCDGPDLSPALSWDSVPDGTVELAIVMVDESVGDGTPFVHWVMAGLDPNALGLIEGDSPVGSIRGLNFFGNLGYNGPCPPPGDPAHIYRLTMYALNQQVELADGTPSGDLLGFIQNVAIASADVSGTFQR
jgi:Raf kinase inhibitor-like YbhB/YbcL family protein